MTQEPITIQNLFRLFLHRKFSIFIKSLILLILLIVFSFIMPHKYISESSIMPSASKGSGGGLAGMLSNVSSSFSFGSIGGDDKSLLFSEILKSRSVADFVIKDIGLDTHPYFKDVPYPELIDFIRYSVETDVLKSGVTNVNFALSTNWFPSDAESDSIASLSAKITNSAIAGLNYVLLNQSMSSAKESRKYIKLEIDSHTNKLDSLERAIQEFQENNNVLEITEQTSTMAKQGLDIAKELSVSELEYEIAKKVYSDNSPQLSSFREKYQILQEQYGKAQKGGLIPTDKFALPVDSIPGLIRIYYDLMRQREIMEHVLIYLQTQYYQEAIQEKKDVSEVEVLDVAKKPHKRAAPVRSVMVVLGSLLIVIFVLTYESFAAYFRGQIFIEKID
jgi:uncharacterized protein involved in exopolysaccharide biosynthesis